MLTNFIFRMFLKDVQAGSAEPDYWDLERGRQSWYVLCESMATQIFSLSIVMDIKRRIEILIYIFNHGRLGLIKIILCFFRLFTKNVESLKKIIQMVILV